MECQKLASIKVRLHCIRDRRAVTLRCMKCFRLTQSEKSSLQTVKLPTIQYKTKRLSQIFSDQAQYEVSDFLTDLFFTDKCIYAMFRCMFGR